MTELATRARGSGHFREPGDLLKNNTWPENPDEVEGRLRSAVAVTESARSSPDLHEEHRKRLIHEAIWFWTERGSVSRKYIGSAHRQR